MITTRSARDIVSFVTLLCALTGLAAAADVHFGPTGISAQETARLNAFCDGSVVPSPCQVTFEFRSPEGRMLLSRTITLQPGTGGFLDLPAERAGIVRGFGQIDPCWDIQLGAAFASLEVFETGNQRTRLLINWGDRSVPRTGDIDFAPAGITPSDTARLSAYCPADERAGGTPCSVLFEFHDSAGRTLKQSEQRIAPGGIAFADFHFAEAASKGRRVTIEPCMRVGDGGAVVATMAIIDDGGSQPGVQSYPAALAVAAQ